jgi:hypothetical protein
VRCPQPPPIALVLLQQELVSVLVYPKKQAFRKTSLSLMTTWIERISAAPAGLVTVSVNTEFVPDPEVDEKPVSEGHYV